MGYGAALEDIMRGKVPDGCMVVKTERGRPEVEVYGINQKCFVIDTDKVEDVIKEIKQKFTNSEIVYVIGKGKKAVEIPGNKIEKMIIYLRAAKTANDAGLAKYTQIF